MFKRYETSGAVGAASFVWALLFALPTIVVVGYVYVKALEWVPHIYLDALFGILYAAAVGYSLHLAFRLGHCRNPKLAMICGGLAGAAAFFITLWMAYPTVEDLKWRYDNGWQISHHGEKGGMPIPALVAWGLEFAILVGFAGGAAKHKLNEAYCEDCGRWVCKPEDTIFNHVESRYDDTPVSVAAKQGDMPALLRAIERGRGQGTLHLILDIRRCVECKGTAYLTVKCKSDKGGKYGKESVTKTFVDQFEVSEEDVNTIKSLFAAARKNMPV